MPTASALEPVFSSVSAAHPLVRASKSSALTPYLAFIASPPFDRGISRRHAQTNRTVAVWSYAEIALSTRRFLVSTRVDASSTSIGCLLIVNNESN